MHEGVAYAQGPFGAFHVAGRVFVAALRNGIDYFRAHPEWWGLVMQGLPVEQIALVRERFDARPPRVVFAYPRGPIEGPTVAVIEATETLEAPLMGDHLEYGERAELALDGVGQVELRGALHSKTLRVQAFAAHPDVAHFIHLWARFVLMGHADFFERVGLQGASFDGAGEIAPDPRFLPTETYSFGQDWTVHGIASLGLPMPDPPSNVFGALEPAGGSVAVVPREDL